MPSQLLLEDQEQLSTILELDSLLQIIMGTVQKDLATQEQAKQDMMKNG